MAEKKFYLESANELHRIGLRAQIASFLMGEGLKDGNVLNDPENKKKVIVGIRADSESKIDEIKGKLVQYLNRLSQDDPQCYGQFPTDIFATRLYDLNNPHTLNLVDLQTLSSSLMLEQTSKGVGAMLSLTEVTRAGFEKLAGTLEQLPAILKKLEKKL